MGKRFATRKRDSFHTHNSKVKSPEGQKKGGGERERGSSTSRKNGQIATQKSSTGGKKGKKGTPWLEGLMGDVGGPDLWEDKKFKKEEHFTAGDSSEAGW